MPIGVLSRVPNSVSQGGACKTNLRGVTPSKPYDYVAPSRTFTVGSALGSISTAGAGAWSNTICQAYYSNDSENSSAITYPSMISTATTGTLLIRIYIQEFPGGRAPSIQTVFQNGQTATNGYGVFLFTVNIFGEPPIYTLYFGRLQDDSSTWVQMNQPSPPGSALNANQWYQFSVGFAPSGTGTSTIRIYQDGSSVSQSDIVEIITPLDGTTQIMNFYGRVTDFALIEKAFTNEQLAAYGTAPYI
jgi:hypothetical protein